MNSLGQMNKQLNLFEVFLMNQEREESVQEFERVHLEGSETDAMIKSWFGIQDLDTHFYRSTPDKGSPYDMSVHHTHRYLNFKGGDEFNSYIGAGLIKCLDSIEGSPKLLFERAPYLIGLNKGIKYLEDLLKLMQKDLNILPDARRFTQEMDKIDQILLEMEYELSHPTSIEFMWGELISFKGMKARLVRGFEVFEGEEGTLVYELLDIAEHPRYSSNIRHRDYESIQFKESQRASKPTRYYGDIKGAGAYLTLVEREEEAINLLKNALLRSNKPVVSSSFGKDSIVSLHLTLRACDLLNIPRSDLHVFYSDTLNEFNEVRKLARYYAKKEGFKLIVTHPKKSLKRIIEEHGGIDESYFSRKGDRRKKDLDDSVKPLSEKCCNILKHNPFYDAAEQYQWDLNVVGTRTDESHQRRQAGIRDGEYFYWQTGGMFKIQPILHWTDEEVFTYIEKYQLQIPYLYHQNLILETPKKKRKTDPELPIQELYDSLNISVDGVVHRPLDALLLKDLGFKVYMPRVGCLLCPIPVKHGYLRWLREFYPKVFKGMLSRVGYATQLVKMIPDTRLKELEFMLGETVTSLTILEKPEIVESILEHMPCAFDQLK